LVIFCCFVLTLLCNFTHRFIYYQMSINALGYCFLLFVVSFIGIVRYKRLSFPFKILTWSVIMIFLTTIIDQFFIIKYRFNGPVLQIQCIEEYIFYSMVYYYLFKNKRIKKFVVISLVIIVVFFPINAVFFQPFLHTFPTNINTSAQVLNTIFSLLLFKEMLDYPVKMNIVRQGIFWFNAAMLFYATTIFFMLGLSNYLAERRYEDKVVSDLWFLIDYLFHILIGIALLTNNSENNEANTYNIINT
jgi:hypothetical protein